MIGINIENLNKLIKINNLNHSSLNENIKKLIANVNELEECYSGNGIHFAFSNILEQKGEIKKIPDIVSNYSDVLASVKKSYEHQDESFQNLFNRWNSQ